METTLCSFNYVNGCTASYCEENGLTWCARNFLASAFEYLSMILDRLLRSFWLQCFGTDGPMRVPDSQNISFMISSGTHETILSVKHFEGSAPGLRISNRKQQAIILV